ncbi:MAG: RNA polymerase sigma factor [Phycisphaerae bacterium]|nr:RNA polymerase sigma factor [Phycisphaerae bacterium]
MSPASDEQLLREFVAGRAASFELLVRRYAQELYQFVYRFTSDGAATDDVIQETFLQVHHSAAGFDPDRRFKPWLFTIAANKARDHLRRRGRLRELPIEARVNEGGESARRFVELFANSDLEADESLSVDERRRAVRKAVEQMPERLREVLILAYYANLPYRDIAEVANIPVGTVKSRLHAAVQSFRTAYERLVRAANSPDQQEEP